MNFGFFFFSNLSVTNIDCFLCINWCCYSDSGFGGSTGYGGSVRSSSSKISYDGTESPRKLDLEGLTPFEKNFYVESPSVAAMSDKEVEEYRQRREITVEGRDVPKPVKSFRDVGFPGNLLLEKFPFFSLFEVLYLFCLACIQVSRTNKLQNETSDELFILHFYCLVGIVALLCLLLDIFLNVISRKKST